MDADGGFAQLPEALPKSRSRKREFRKWSAFRGVQVVDRVQLSGHFFRGDQNSDYREHILDGWEKQFPRDRLFRRVDCVHSFGSHISHYSHKDARTQQQ